MLDFLYSLGQVLCLLGLAWGAILAIGTSDMVGPHRARRERRLRTGRARGHPTREDPTSPLSATGADRSLLPGSALGEGKT